MSATRTGSGTQVRSVSRTVSGYQTLNIGGFDLINSATVSTSGVFPSSVATNNLPISFSSTYTNYTGTASTSAGYSALVIFSNIGKTLLKDGTYGFVSFNSQTNDYTTITTASKSVGISMYQMGSYYSAGSAVLSSKTIAEQYGRVIYNSTTQNSTIVPAQSLFTKYMIYSNYTNLTLTSFPSSFTISGITTSVNDTLSTHRSILMY
jgi:hypothetical protein